MNFSKSRYCEFCQCAKAAWLHQHKPEKYVESESAKARMDKGNKVGDLAMHLFGKFDEATVLDENKKPIISAMIERTKQLMAEGSPVICEASFDFNGLYCAVDILKKTPDGYAIYEVKSATHIKPINILDVSYQKYVLEKCGINVTGTYLVTLNNKYVLDGELDIQQLFKIEDISDEVAEEIKYVEENLEQAERILACEIEPDIDLNECCKDCGYFGYCGAHLPTPSVFDIYKLPFKTQLMLYYKGVITYEDVLADGYITDDLRLRQIDFALHDRGTHIDKEGIKKFLNKLVYPLYFLDFETMQMVVPEYAGTKPYQQIPFQYSLHYIINEGGEIRHKEFLGEPEIDPRRAFAEQLVKDIPGNGTVLVYNQTFEGPRLKELAEAFPDLAKRLLKIRDNIVDLIVPFRAGYYYNKAMGGSFSIKSVLPAIYPDDPSLDYHNLEGIHNGGEAMSEFPAMKEKTPEERAIIRHNLLKYCELDTYAMVKVWQELVRVAHT